MKPGIDAEQFRLHIVRPALERLGLWSEAAENLLLGTAAQESYLGHFLHQLGGGPAIGPFQMEPATHQDIWTNYLDYRPKLASIVLAIAGKSLAPEEALAYNLRYAAAMARIQYRRVPQRLPDANDIEGLARYWKDHYNTSAGAGTVEEFIENYQRFLT